MNRPRMVTREALMTQGNLSAVWRQAPADLTGALKAHVDRGVERSLAASIRPDVFFRADDIGVPTDNFKRLLDLFVRFRVPLALALVPAWLTPSRWRALRRAGDGEPRLWCWHQHGWRHINHVPQGKKGEFGDQRTREDLRRDLTAGWQRLHALACEPLQPLFTPPWNRCGAKTLELLPQLGFKAVSRTAGSHPAAPASLAEWAVNVDLHTRKEKDPQTGWIRLVSEIEAGIACGVCGVMIHHDRMNGAAFAFLEQLLLVLTTHSGIALVNLAEHLQTGEINRHT